MPDQKRVLVTGATGYIGGRLVPLLIESGVQVRCLSRDPSKLDGIWWRDQVEVAQGDLLDASSLEGVFDGCTHAVYLVHSMDQKGGDFGERDRQAARNFGEAMDGAGVQRAVYLGGLGHGELSPHLASRQEVGQILASGSTPATELRAAVIIGSGSVSFEMLRYLTEVLPAMVTPKWVRTMCQPIAIRDVLQVIISAIDDEGESVVREIGGPDRLSYEQMMRTYAQVAGLPRRLIVQVPLLTPRLSSLWVGLVTPLPTGVARPLVDSLTVEVTVGDNSYAESVAGPLLGYRESVSEALERANDLDVPTRWSGAAIGPASPFSDDPSWSGGTVKTDQKKVKSTATADDLFWAFSRIGGNVGYYALNWAWRLRGTIDSIVGGVGLRRGRRHPETIRKGESLDFWRVVDVEPGRSLRLYAEMRLPGEAWLSFEADGSDPGSTLTQTAVFVPRGLFGRLYWWAMFPFHIAIFRLMAARVVAAAEERAASRPGE
ncbi:MAG TPA: SDR family oxidoreductase [Acidimicrobiia bacterium]|nr:SDR family oxidoreductase [Acidimicrobiia bacterium]